MGSGPYRITNFTPKPEDRIRRRQRIDRQKRIPVTVRNYSSDSNLLKAARSGDVDLAIPADPASADSLADDQNLRVSAGTSENKVTLLYNNDADSILSDVQARTALRMMLDKTALLKDRSDVAQPLGGSIGPLEPGYEDLTGLIAHNADTEGASL